MRRRPPPAESRRPQESRRAPRRSEHPRPPFVRGLPFIGNAWEMGTDPGAFFVKCYREAGPIFRIRLFNKPYTVLAGPEANRFIAREGDTHLRSKEFWQEFVEEFGAKKSLINTDGEMHDKIRNVMKRGYGRASISGRYQELIDITDRMLQDEWQPGQRLRVVPAMQRLAAEQLGIMVAGRAPGEYVDDLRVFIRYALNVLVVHMRPRIMLRMPDYRRAKKRIFELDQRMIDSYDPSRVDPKQPTLIDDIMAAAKQDETLFEGAELMMAVLGPYFAGLDTVANTTSAMLYAVLKHRDVHEQVLAEVDGVFAAGPCDSRVFAQHAGAPRRGHGDPAHVSDRGGRHAQRHPGLRVRRSSCGKGRAALHCHHGVALSRAVLFDSDQVRHHALRAATKRAQASRRLRPFQSRCPHLPRYGNRRGADRAHDGDAVSPVADRARSLRLSDAHESRPHAWPRAEVQRTGPRSPALIANPLLDFWTSPSVQLCRALAKATKQETGEIMPERGMATPRR